MQSFINPYNFIPFGNTIEEKRTSRESVYRGGETLKSGWLDVKILAKAPLIVPDGAHPDERKSNLHEIYEFYHVKDEAGEPRYMIPGSELRGMLRSAYEAVTDSCIPFLLNDMPISQRVPVFGSLQRRGLLKYNLEHRQWTLYSVSEPLDQDIVVVEKGEDNYILRYENGKVVTEKPGTFVEGRGWIQYNIPVDLKKDYHVTYLTPIESENGGKGVKTWPEGDDEPYKMLESCLARDGVKGHQKNPNEEPAKAIKIALDKAKKTGENMVPVWFFMVNRGKEKLVYLSNSSIGRLAQRRKWIDIMGNYAPCKSTDKLCPACLLFGTAAGEGLKGHVRIMDALPEDELSFETHILQILGEPRTSAFEFYLEKPESATYWNFDFYGKTTFGNKPEEDKTEYYDLEEAAPRGRKMYWHGDVMPDRKKMDKMNATMKAAEKNSEFSFRIYFDEITDAQLTDLIWVITLGDNQKDSTLQHKLGHAKPLGYGSVKLIITEGKIRRMEKSESGWKPVVTPMEISQKPKSTFSTNSEHVKSLLEMCNTQKTKGMSVMYPRLTGKNDDGIYQWFSKNRKSAKTLKTLPKPTDIKITLDDFWMKNKADTGRVSSKGKENEKPEAVEATVTWVDDYGNIYIDLPTPTTGKNRIMKSDWRKGPKQLPKEGELISVQFKNQNTNKKGKIFNNYKPV